MLLFTDNATYAPVIDPITTPSSKNELNSISVILFFI